MACKEGKKMECVFVPSSTEVLEAARVEHTTTSDETYIDQTETDQKV
jgi:hypothetical protein